MPEIKNQFTAGKMNKDLDERLIPNGEYRDAMNIQVSTSEDSEVGTAQNILGNRFISIIGNGQGLDQPDTVIGAVVLGSIADEKIDTLYYLMWTAEEGNFIISYRRGDQSPEPVLVDKNNILNFNGAMLITGINVIDDMLFFTDNKNEPKKININRCKAGTNGNWTQHTKLVNESQGIFLADNIDIQEEHITMIKQAPKYPLSVETVTSRPSQNSSGIDLIYTGVVTISTDTIIPNSFVDPNFFNFSQFNTSEDSNTFDINITEALDPSGNIISIGNVGASNGLTGWHKPQPDYTNTTTERGNILPGTKIVLKPFDLNGTPPGIPVTDFVMKGVVEDIYDNDPRTTGATRVRIRLTTIDGVPPIVPEGYQDWKYVIDIFEEDEKLFEFKFPRFSYRYKYEDGEYSPFAPFTQVVFVPGSFDYHPRKGYNLGMTNRLKKIILKNSVTEEIQKDVVSVDILFKDDISPVIYIVETIGADDSITSTGSSENLWNKINYFWDGYGYEITKETINAAVPSNQLLRLYDNVPRKALAQDVTGNRVVYANYVQNYTLKNKRGEKYNPGDFNVSWIEFNPTQTEAASSTTRSIKSLREYQVGVVFTDKYGRETPVLSNASSALRLEKERADKNNRLRVKLNDEGNRPEDLKYMKFYVKETAGEYYNMALDRFYDAEDGNIWLAFASADRNKVDIDSFLILKKGSDQDSLVTAQARYKILDIQNEAPRFIKTSKKLAVEQYHAEGTSDQVFNSGLVNCPVIGEDEFELHYKPFFGGPGGGLANYRDGKLWVEFCIRGLSQTSDRYRVTSIHTDYEPAGGTLSIGSDTAKYYVKLDRNLGDDVNFISDDSTGAAASEIIDGAGIKFYKYEIEDLAKFDGRFFVKIYSDEVFKNNIGKSFKEGLPFRRIASQKIYLMNKLDHAHIVTRDLGTDSSGNVGDQECGFTDGYVRKSWLTGYTNVVPDFNSSEDLFMQGLFTDTPQFMSVEPEEYTWGYYLIPEFASFQLFFKRFLKANHNYSYPGDYNFVLWSSMDPYYVNHFKEDKCPYLKSLELGSLSSVTKSWDLGLPSIEYKNISWREMLGWNLEMGINAKGYIAGFDTPGTSLEEEVHYLQDYEMQTHPDPDKRTTAPIDSGVWFIDRGPYTARRDGSTNLYWRWDWGADGGNPVKFAGCSDSFVRHQPRFSDGLKINSDGESWRMELAYGGIVGAYESPIGNTIEDFFNLADWQTPGGEPNKHHNEGPFNNFINTIDTGVQFRWAEDPTRTIFTVSSVDGSKGMKVRHSPVGHVGGYTDGGGARYLGPGGTFKAQDAGWWYPANLTGYSVDPADPWPDFMELPAGQGMVDGHHPLANPPSMGEKSASNFSRGWNFKDIRPVLEWNPISSGQLSDCLDIELFACDENGNTSGNGKTSTGSSYSDDLIIYTKSIFGDNSGPLIENQTSAVIHEGMALKKYENKAGTFAELQASTHLTSNAEQFLIVRFIETVNADDAENKYFKLHLGGYTRCLNDSLEYKISEDVSSTRSPKIGGRYQFVQVGMNSISSNTEFNITVNGQQTGKWGAMGAVGYTLEFVETIEPEEIITENPAVFETEPKDIKELDIYYEASAAVPYVFDKTNVHQAFPIGSVLRVQGATITDYAIVDYRSEKLYIDTDPTTSTNPIQVGQVYKIIRPDDLEISIEIDDVDFSNAQQLYYIEIKPNLYTSSFRLPWHNCYSFGNGVESNRIRDNFNLPFISNGVRVSTTLETGYEEEHRKYGLIYSGIYNSVSGVNNLNQFIAGEKITKEINPIYGSIQKLHSRDSDLVTLCEDKILKILANKDAVFNADGNTNLTATENVLGQTIPFVGEYGISTNPESFASESYRAYFTDKVRGAVMRLSKDGLTPISDQGMKDWFKDNLKLSIVLKGSYDDKKDEYNIKLQNARLIDGSIEDFSKVVTYKENVKGWVSFKSFIQMNHANSMGNDYYTFYKGGLYIHHAEEKGIPRNTFYNIFEPSSIDVVLNNIPSSVKIFSTLNYEGSQAKIDKFERREFNNIPYQVDSVYNDQEFYNLSDKKGWYNESIITNKEDGYISEFLEKEGKWFNFINKEIDFTLLQADSGDFSFQGLGRVAAVNVLDDGNGNGEQPDDGSGNGGGGYGAVDYCPPVEVTTSADGLSVIFYVNEDYHTFMMGVQSVGPDGGLILGTTTSVQFLVDDDDAITGQLGSYGTVLLDPSLFSPPAGMTAAYSNNSVFYDSGSYTSYPPSIQPIPNTSVNGVILATIPYSDFAYHANLNPASSLQNMNFVVSFNNSMPHSGGSCYREVSFSVPDLGTQTPELCPIVYVLDNPSAKGYQFYTNDPLPGQGGIYLGPANNYTWTIEDSGGTVVSNGSLAIDGPQTPGPIAGTGATGIYLGYVSYADIAANSMGLQTYTYDIQFDFVTGDNLGPGCAREIDFYPVIGCGIPTALNYEPNANIQLDDICIFSLDGDVPTDTDTGIGIDVFDDTEPGRQPQDQRIERRLEGAQQTLAQLSTTTTTTTTPTRETPSTPAPTISGGESPSREAPSPSVEAPTVRTRRTRTGY